MTLLVATTNAGKLDEINRLLSDLTGVDLESLAVHPDIPAPVETGATFAANAALKATYYSTRTGRLTLAEDSGLEVDALDGAPGVRSARFNGSSYVEKCAAIQNLLQARGAVDAAARFVCALAVARGAEVIFSTTAAVEGQIAAQPRGAGGFGYDPIFFYPPYGRTLAEVPPAAKNAVSHRGRAVRRLRSFLAARDGEERRR